MSPDADGDLPGGYESVVEVYETALFTLSDTVFLACETGEFRWVCPNVDHIFGWSAAEVREELTVASLLGESLTPTAVLDDGREGAHNLETTVTDSQGDVHHLLVTLQETDLAGETVYLYACRDVTERARLETELDEVFERVTDGIIALDTDFEITYANDYAAEVFQRERSALVGTTLWEHSPDPESTVAYEAFPRALETGETVSYETYFEPTDRWYEARAFPSESGLSVYFTDITERVERERELEETARHFQALFDGTTDALVLLDDDALVRDANPAMCALLGYDRNELLERRASALVDDASDFDFEATWETFLEEGELNGQVSLVRSDGETRIVEYRAVSDIRPGQHLGALRDVTARVRQREELESSERRFRALFEGTLDALIIADDEGRYLDVNPAACELFGRPREDLLGRTPVDFAPPGFDFEAAWGAFLESDAQRGEFEIRLPDGEIRIAEFAATPDIRPGEHLSALRDITTRVEREQLLEAQRDKLAQVSRINDLIREVNRSLVGATSRTDALRSVADSVGESALYDTVAVVTLGATPEVVATSSVDEDALLDAEPLVSSVETVYDEARSVDLTLDGDVLGGLRHVSLFPLCYGGSTYGVLLVGRVDGEGLTDEERGLLDELGTTVGKAVATVASQELLHADSVVGLSLETGDTDVYARLAAAAGGTVSGREVVPADESRQIHYVDVQGDVEAAADTAASIAGVRHCRIVQHGDGGASLCELVVDTHSGVSVVGTLVEQGGHVLEATADGDTCRLEAEVTPDTDVRGLMSRIRADHAGSRLLGKRRTIPTPQGRRPVSDQAQAVRSSPGSELTARQLGVLRAAATAGYFEWPRRGTTAEELADSFGLASATLHQHLRVATGKVVDRYLAETGRGHARV